VLSQSLATLLERPCGSIRFQLWGSASLSDLAASFRILQRTHTMLTVQIQLDNKNNQRVASNLRYQVSKD
jgi:hypothetical protein